MGIVSVRGGRESIAWQEDTGVLVGPAATSLGKYVKNQGQEYQQLHSDFQPGLF